MPSYTSALVVTYMHHRQTSVYVGLVWMGRSLEADRYLTCFCWKLVRVSVVVLRM
jgi:hypothetical protein